jgi:primosomal protein N' (replication factor Y)
MHSLFEPLEDEVRTGTQLAPVLLAVALDQTYDYLVPLDLTLEPGCFVMVPFGPQSRIGVVWDRPVSVSGGEPGKPVDPRKLKTITARLDVPPLPEISLRFAEWIAKYTLAPLGMTARMMMSARAVFEPQKPRFGVTIVEGAAEPPRMTPARKRALDIAADGGCDWWRAKPAVRHSTRTRDARVGLPNRDGNERVPGNRP